MQTAPVVREQRRLALMERRQSTITNSLPMKLRRGTLLGRTSKFRRTVLGMMRRRSRITRVRIPQSTRLIRMAISTRIRAGIAPTSRSSATTFATNGLFSRVHPVPISQSNGTTLILNSPFGRMRPGRTSLARRNQCTAIPTHSRTSVLTSSRQRVEPDLAPRNR